MPALVLGCLQAVEHYEISRCGTLKTWANELGYDDAVQLLDASGEDPFGEEPSENISKKLLDAILIGDDRHRSLGGGSQRHRGLRAGTRLRDSSFSQD